MEYVYLIIRYKHGRSIYIKRKEGEREQDARETERVSVRERAGGCEKR